MTQSTYQRIVNHCKKEYPIEACGLLSGDNGIVTTVWPMINIHRSKNSFFMSKVDIKKVFDAIEQRNEQFIGIYHSHPTDIAYPSREDVHFNNYQEAFHLIVSLATKQPVVKAYKYKKTTVIPYQIKVTGD